MERINQEYLDTEGGVIIDMNDEDYLDWLDCDDCSRGDYEDLIEFLRDNGMHDREAVTWDYLNSF